MNIGDVSKWMRSQLETDGCLYQDDVVDFLVKNKFELLLNENADGNLVLTKSLLNEFRDVAGDEVVWVKPERYWRFRVPEDEPQRDARG